MLSLIKKDFLQYNILLYFAVIFIIALMTITTLPATLTIMGCLLALAFSLFSYDHMKKVNIFLKSMPISIHQIVIGRYLFAVLLNGAIVLIQWALQTLFANSFLEFEAVYQWQDFYVFFLLFCLVIGVCFPIIYFFQNIYLAIFPIMLLIIAGIYFILDILVDILAMTEQLAATGEILFNDIDMGLKTVVEHFFPYAPYIFLFIGTFLFLCMSILCSIYFFKRKAY